MFTYYDPIGPNTFFWKQTISLLISLFFYFLISGMDIRYLKKNYLIISLYLFVVLLFVILAILGSAFSGAQS
jgi:cell division protein FtsW (lipid II flippase)